MPSESLNPDASIKYWNEVWLDELIDEAFRLIKEKAVKIKGKAEEALEAMEYGPKSENGKKIPPSVLKR